MNVALFSSQLLSQINRGTLVILVYDRETVLQVIHNRGHGFQKVLPCRGAQIATHTRSTSEKPNQNPTRPSRQSNHKIQKYFRGATPWSTPATKLADSETDSRLVGPAVNDWEPENSSLSIQRKWVTIPKQYSVLSIAQFK